jgi:hypothetical protein
MKFFVNKNCAVSPGWTASGGILGTLPEKDGFLNLQNDGSIAEEGPY